MDGKTKQQQKPHSKGMSLTRQLYTWMRRRNRVQ